MSKRISVSMVYIYHTYFKYGSILKHYLCKNLKCVNIRPNAAVVQLTITKVINTETVNMATKKTTHS